MKMTTTKKGGTVMADTTEDGVQKLFEDAGLTDERMEEIAAHFRCAVDEQVMQELASSLTFMKEQVTEELVDQLDNYLHEAFSELEQRLDEDNERVAEMIYLAADSKSSDEFIARAAASARETASDRSGPPHNVDDVPDSEAERNRKSLKPGAGTNFGSQGIRESTEEGREYDPRIAPYMKHLAKHGSQALAQQALQESADDEIDPKVERYIQHAEKMAELYPEKK